MDNLLIVLCLVNLLWWGGALKAAPTKPVFIYPEETVSRDYIGNGVQWDPYELDYGHGRMSISPEDWHKLYDRLDYMHPQFIRIMINTPRNNNAVGSEGYEKVETLFEILDYCQSRDITVMFGDWGGSFFNHKTKEIDAAQIRNAARFVKEIVDAKGYDCVKYYNFINEPNGWWSSTGGDSELWLDAVSLFDSALEEEGMTGKIELVGPDIAIWDKDENWWIEKTDSRMGAKMGLYDIHTYPSKYTVTSGEFQDIVKSYRDLVPEGRQMVMGEIGLKYVHPADSLLSVINIEKARNHAHASQTDSQMSVYEPEYGIYMADALMQTVSAGYSGAVAWMLDDAMHANEAPDKLKIWGMWNIFGEEFFGEDEERIRPWYYAWSLLCRYMPSGSRIIGTSHVGDCRINVVEKEGRKSIFILNPTLQPVEMEIMPTGNFGLENAKMFVYNDRTVAERVSDNRLMHEPDPVTIQVSSPLSISVSPQTLVTITDFDY